ncbi:MAG: hypothetical protein B0D91_14385 [Oceanospirillales bacterium LUC14_002_19_P2]|nr:MAG: hypothetical protein B0D91_14385 [Oceanospirillales bacterium LUC14_002_19_P2]
MGFFDKVKTAFNRPSATEISASASDQHDGKTAELIRVCLEALGGQENIAGPVQVAMTRVRVEVLNPERINREQLKASGLLGHMVIGDTVVHLLAGDQAAELAKGLQS